MNSWFTDDPLLHEHRYETMALLHRSASTEFLTQSTHFFAIKEMCIVSKSSCESKTYPGITLLNVLRELSLLRKHELSYRRSGLKMRPFNSVHATLTRNYSCLPWCSVRTKYVSFVYVCLQVIVFLKSLI